MVTYCPAFREPPGEARADWEIFAAVGRRLGFAAQFEFADSSAVYREFITTTKGRPCDMTQLSHRRLQTLGPTQWPCPGYPTDPPEREREPKRLYTSLSFNTPNGRANFSAFHAKGLAEPPSESYPLVLTVGPSVRALAHHESHRSCGVN